MFVCYSEFLLLKNLIFAIVRLWDIRNSACVKTLLLGSAATSIELSSDRNNLTVAHGNMVTIVDSDR